MYSEYYNTRVQWDVNQKHDKDAWNSQSCSRRAKPHSNFPTNLITQYLEAIFAIV